MSREKIDPKDWKNWENKNQKKRHKRAKKKRFIKEARKKKRQENFK